MAISVFPAGGEDFVTNDFVIDMNDTANNVIDLGRSYAQGAYDISLASGDTSFDIYAVDADGNSVGYTTDATLVTTDAFTQIAILGVAQDERITFAFAGASNDANAEGTATGAGAYLENATPTDLGNQDDTTTVTGGNFASDVQIFFESGATSTAAKNITRNDSTELIVTRPDALDPSLDPWSLRAVNPGIPEPTGSNANILANVIDAGALPVWVTTSPLPDANFGQAYSETLEATDADGSVSYSVTVGQLPTGLSLNSTTGEISGTPTGENETFTVTATDEGGNTNSREFTISLILAEGGTITTDGAFTVHTFTSSDDFIVYKELTNVEYQVIAGGGGGGGGIGVAGGGGGAGGFRSSIASDPSSGRGAALESTFTLPANTYPILVGTGGIGSPKGGNAVSTSGGSSSFHNVTSFGGGRGGDSVADAGNGGAGGGGRANGGAGGLGTSGQGFDGNGSNGNTSGSGGGAIGVGTGGAIVTNVTGSSESVAGGTNGSSNNAGGRLTNVGSGGRAGANFSDGLDGQIGRVIVRYVA